MFTYFSSFPKKKIVQLAFNSWFSFFLQKKRGTFLFIFFREIIFCYSCTFQDLICNKIKIISVKTIIFYFLNLFFYNFLFLKLEFFSQDFFQKKSLLSFYIVLFRCGTSWVLYGTSWKVFLGINGAVGFHFLLHRRMEEQIIVRR